MATLLKVVKIALGSGMAILIAQQLGIQYSASAGIITLLSIQDTKKQTLVVAMKRGVAFILAIFIARIVFSLGGYSAITFAVFLFIFVMLCTYAKLQDGISMCAVLVTHFLVEQSMSVSWIRNESMLMIIGIGMGIVLNLYIPRDIKQMRVKQNEIETEIKLILKGIATYLIDEKQNFNVDYDFQILNNQINYALKQAYDDQDNMLRYENRYFIKYMQMRKSQVLELEHILTHLPLMTCLPQQATKISFFIDQIIMTLRESNNAEKLLRDLHILKAGFKLEELPKTRLEFEDRAILYHLLNSLEQFLEFKRSFAENLTKDEKKDYWKIEDG